MCYQVHTEEDNQESLQMSEEEEEKDEELMRWVRPPGIILHHTNEVMWLNFNKIIQISSLLVEGIVFLREEEEINNFISLAHEVFKNSGSKIKGDCKG